MTNDKLKNCIATLQQIRDTYNGQLDTGVIERLDEVIIELQSQVNSSIETDRFDTGAKVLKVLADVLAVVVKITDFM